VDLILDVVRRETRPVQAGQCRQVSAEQCRAGQGRAGQSSVVSCRVVQGSAVFSNWLRFEIFEK